MEINDRLNPWAVSRIEEFLFFCCPECNEQIQSKKKTQSVIKLPFVTPNVMHDLPQAFNLKLNLPYNEFKHFEHSILILQILNGN